MKEDAAAQDEFDRLMHSESSNRQYLAPKDGTGGAVYLAVWKACSAKRNKMTTAEYLKRNEKLGEDKDEELNADGTEAYTPEQKKEREIREKKRRALLVKDAIKQQEIMKELATKKEKEIVAKAVKFDQEASDERREKETFFDCQIEAEIPIAKTCYDKLRQGRETAGSHKALDSKYNDPYRMNLADRPFIEDFVMSHEFCTAQRAEYRRWECQRMFATDGPGQQCRKKDAPDCAKVGSCGRTHTCDPGQKYSIRRDWDEEEQRLNVDEGGFSCGPVCTTIDASYPNGAEREGYIHTVPLTWHREAWLPPQLYPNTTYRMRGDLPHLMIGFNPGGKAYASGGQGSYGGNQYRYAHCGKLHHPCNNKGTWGDESINFWETTRNAVMKAQLLKDNIHKARRGIIYNELWMPYHKTRDQRGVPNMDALRKVGMIEVVAVPGSPGVFTPQIWLAMSPMSAYHGGAQGSEGEDVPTWAGTGMGQCPPFGVGTRIFIAEIPHFSTCAERCDLFFRDINFMPGSPIAPNKNLKVMQRNPELLAKLEKNYAYLKKDWDRIMQVSPRRTHDDSPFMLKKFHAGVTGHYGGAGRRRCYGGPGYRKTNIVAMTFDVVTAEEKHLFLMDVCGRIISTVVVGPLGKEELIYQQELAGIKCRERALHGGNSHDGVGSDAAFTTFYGRWYSGASLSIYTDKVTDQKYMAVAEGWKSKLRSVKLGRRVLTDPKDNPYLYELAQKNKQKKELGESDSYSYKWTTPMPQVKDANTITLGPMVAPRKLSAGESDNLYVVTQAAMIWDIDLKPQVSCEDMRKVFGTVMKNNPSNYWRHHFGFDKWMPDETDSSQQACEITNFCHGQDEYAQPVCDCDGETKIAPIICKQHQWEACTAKACKDLGPTCKTTILRGKKKQSWAKQWWKQLNDESKVNIHNGWEHFPVQKLRKTMRYCLIRKSAKMPTKGAVNEKSSPEKKAKEVQKKAAVFEQRKTEIHAECGAKYGSWWSLALMKQVQMIRHLCGPPSAASNGLPTPGKDCPVLYLTKMTTCNSQEGRPEQKPLCCSDKSMSNFISPRMAHKGGHKKLDISAKLHGEVLDKLKLF